MYIALNFYDDKKFNNIKNYPVELEKKFGIRVNPLLSFTMLQFKDLIKFLTKENYNLSINRKSVTSFRDFIKQIIFSKISFHQAIDEIKKSIDNNVACGIDVPIKYKGLLDHVMFVYGYDEDNLFVIDTRKVKYLNYSHWQKQQFLFRISLEEIENRWTRFGRVWIVKRRQK